MTIKLLLGFIFEAKFYFILDKFKIVPTNMVDDLN